MQIIKLSVWDFLEKEFKKKLLSEVKINRKNRQTRHFPSNEKVM